MNGERGMSTKENRLRCPQCGTCYEGDSTADELQDMQCKNCGANTKLLEEDPEGICSGAYPPAQRLILIGLTLFLCAVAVKLPFFSILAFCLLVLLAVDIFQGHKGQRADRISLWDMLRNTYKELKQKNNEIEGHLNKTMAALSELSERYEKISPEIHGQLAAEIEARKKALGVLGEIETLASEKKRFSETRDSLSSEIDSIRKTLGMLNLNYS